MLETAFDREFLTEHEVTQNEYKSKVCIAKSFKKSKTEIHYYIPTPKLNIKQEASKLGFTHEIEHEQEFGNVKKYYKLLTQENLSWKSWRTCASLGGIAAVVYNEKQAEVMYKFVPL